MPSPIVPSLLYGTAWKKARTSTLVHTALKAGFRGIDTARQPKHYREDLVADGVCAALAEGTCTRSDLYIQTKFTPVGGQDPSNIPYDASLPVREQVAASVRGSLANFTFPGSDSPYLDCVVLHSPLATFEATLEAWTALATFVKSGDVHSLGLSNVDARELQALCEQGGEVRPSVVQNRFYAGNHWCRDVRALCRQEGIDFQSFWTLTANPSILSGELVGMVADVSKVSKEVAMYGLVMGLGDGSGSDGRIVVLNGTTNEGRMKSDLEGIERLSWWRESNAEAWEQCMANFRQIVDEE